MKFTARQKEIIDIVRDYQPITGEKIASKLNLSRATLRPDFTLLTMVEVLGARPKVGYYYLGHHESISQRKESLSMSVEEVMSLPTLVDEQTSIYDAIVSLFLEDVGTLFVTNEGLLTGVVSRKDLLRSFLGGQTQTTPVGVLMTREPKIIKVDKDASVLEATKLIVEHDIDAIPVVTKKEGGYLVVGRYTKTNIAKLFVEMLGND